MEENYGKVPSGFADGLAQKTLMHTGKRLVSKMFASLFTIFVFGVALCLIVMVAAFVAKGIWGIFIMFWRLF